MIEVLLSAPQLTVQDTGRRGQRHLGVPRCGMLDALALQKANLLLGNQADAAGLEITFGPVQLRAHTDLHIVLMGKDLLATLQRDGRSDGRSDGPSDGQNDGLSDGKNDGKKRSAGSFLTPGFVHFWPAGTTLRLRAAANGIGRSCLAVAGGIDVPMVLGSRSTDLANRFGGLHGRALVTGDRLPVGSATVWPVPLQGLRQSAADGQLRILPGPDYPQLDEAARDMLLTTPWRVTQSSNRMGLRLEGPQLDVIQTGPRLSFGVLPGQIQVPADGQPIILAADAQTTGGYPCIASVISADLWQLAYLTPGARITFSEVDIALAQRYHQQQVTYLQSLADRFARPPAAAKASGADAEERAPHTALETSS